MNYQQCYSKPVMPLLINFTPLYPIQVEEANEKYRYNYVQQIVEYNMKTAGTKCTKRETTKRKTASGVLCTTDVKQALDDTKNV